MAELTTSDIVVRVVAGAVLGALVGIERESAGQDAGFRTHLLLALGAALFGVISVGGFSAYFGDQGQTNVRVDVSRVASYVAAGIGFIGGGVILKHAGTVRGITTAASVWVAAAIGLSAGLGFWAGAISATVIALIALAVLKPLSEWIGRRHPLPRTMTVEITGAGTGSSVVEMMQREVSSSIKSIRIGRVGDEPGDGHTEVAIEFWTDPDDAVVDSLTQRIEQLLGTALRSISIKH